MNIGMHMILTCKQEQKLNLPTITEELFILSDFYLKETSKHQAILRMFASYDRMDKYRSILDMLLCEIFPEFRRGCFSFYKGEGPQLKYIASEELIEYLDKAIYLCLRAANELVKRNMIYPGKVAFIATCRELINHVMDNNIKKEITL